MGRYRSTYYLGLPGSLKPEPRKVQTISTSAPFSAEVLDFLVGPDNKYFCTSAEVVDFLTSPENKYFCTSAEVLDFLVGPDYRVVLPAAFETLVARKGVISGGATCFV